MLKYAKWIVIRPFWLCLNSSSKLACLALSLLGSFVLFVNKWKIS